MTTTRDDVPVLVRRLESAGVRLWTEGGQVRFDGPQDALPDPVLDELRAHRDAVAGLLAARGPRVLPGAAEQRRLWRSLKHLANPDVWLNCFYADVGTRLDVRALQAALDALVVRHEQLRTSFTDDDGELLLTVYPTASAPIRVMAPGGDLGAQCRAFTLELDPASPPLLRLAVVPGRDSDLLVVAAHHIVTDGATVELVGDELAALYREARDGVPADLPVAPPFSAFADREREWARTHQPRAVAERVAELGAPVRPLAFTPAPDADPDSSFDGEANNVWLTLSADQGPALAGTAQQLRVPQFAVMAAACAVLVRDLTGRTDCVVGMSAACRAPGEERTFGLLRRHLPVRVDLRTGDTWGALVTRCGQEVFHALRAPLLSCDELERAWLGEISVRRSFPQILLTHMPGVVLGVDLGAGFVPWEEFAMAGGRSELVMEVISAADAVRIGMETFAELAGPQSLRVRLDHYAELLRGCLADPASPVPGPSPEGTL